jgi:hypothetical protein
LEDEMNVRESYEELKRLYPRLARLCSYERFTVLADCVMEPRKDDSRLRPGEAEHVFMRVINDFL